MDNADAGDSAERPEEAAAARAGPAAGGAAAAGTAAAITTATAAAAAGVAAAAGSGGFATASGGFVVAGAVAASAGRSAPAPMSTLATRRLLLEAPRAAADVMGALPFLPVTHPRGALNVASYRDPGKRQRRRCRLTHTHQVDTHIMLTHTHQVDTHQVEHTSG